MSKTRPFGAVFGPMNTEEEWARVSGRLGASGPVTCPAAMEPQFTHEDWGVVQRSKRLDCVVVNSVFAFTDCFVYQQFMKQFLPIKMKI